MRILLGARGLLPLCARRRIYLMHGYITAMPEHEFVLWVIGAHAADRGKFVYELPGNVVEVHEVFLTMPCGFRASSTKPVLTTVSARRYAVWCRSPIRTGTCYLISSTAVACIRSRFAEPHVYGYLSRRALPSTPTRPLPTLSTPCVRCCCPCSICWAARLVADVYHAISTGYGGLLACLAQAFTMRRCC